MKFFDDSWEHGIGIAAVDKTHGDPELKVLIRQLLPFQQGQVKSELSKHTHTLYDTETEQLVDVAVTSTSHVTCTYIGGTNTSIPDIYQGEQIRVYHLENSSEFYWAPMGRDDKLRPREKKEIYISDSGARNTPLTEDNTYGIVFDTLLSKRLRIHTAKTDGEAYVYELHFDSDNNKVYLCDDSGNEILIESDTPRIVARNRSGTEVDLNVEDMSLTAPRQVVVSSPVMTTNITDGDGVSVINTKGLALNSDQLFAVKAALLSLQGGPLIVDEIFAKKVYSANGYTIAGSPDVISPATDTSEGTGSIPSNIGAGSGGADNNRHGCAWEEVSEALYAIAQALELLDSFHGVLSGEPSTIRALAQHCKMNMMRGD